MDVLQSMGVIGLEEMDGVKLMDRTDTKFVFNISRLPQFLEKLSGDYKVLQVNDCLMSRYETLYFDTKDFDLYKKHHSGKLNRYKIRCRKYVESGIYFFEIKFKNNKGRTIKHRIKEKDFLDSIKGASSDLLRSKTPLEPGSLIPNLWVLYSRITLVNIVSKERVTIDTELKVQAGDKSLSFPQIAIAEVKQEKSQGSPFISLMKKQGIRQGSLSKYCFGVANLYDEVKKNSFKSQIRLIKKINYDTFASA